jgi:hypothetical protein
VGKYLFVDYRNVECYNYDTQTLTKDAVAYTEVFSNYPDYGQLAYLNQGPFFEYRPFASTNGNQDLFNIRPFLKDGTNSIIIDYEMNIVPWNVLTQLLDVPRFSVAATNSVANLLISAYERDTGARVARDDGYFWVYYPPSNGTISRHVSGYPDVFTYVANPGFSGWDVVGVAAENNAGKIGYNTFYIYVSP